MTKHNKKEKRQGMDTGAERKKEERGKGWYISKKNFY